MMNKLKALVDEYNNSMPISELGAKIVLKEDSDNIILDCTYGNYDPKQHRFMYDFKEAIIGLYGLLDTASNGRINEWFGGYSEDIKTSSFTIKIPKS